MATTYIHWELRALLTLTIHERGGVTVAELADVVRAERVGTTARESKLVSDSLRAIAAPTSLDLLP